MKNILILSAFALCLFPLSIVQAQEKQVDLEIQVVNNEQEVFVPFGEQYSVRVLLTNHGPNIIEEGDMVRFRLVGGIATVINDIHLEINQSIVIPNLILSANEDQMEDEVIEFCYEILESPSYVDNNSANNTSCITIILEGHPISINETAHMASLKLYPNPVKEGVLYFESPWTDRQTHFSIMDITGRKVFEKPLSIIEGNIVEVSVPDLVEGTYLLELESQGRVVVEKFIIVR